MSEAYQGVKFKSEKVGDFRPDDFERAEINRLVSLKDIYLKYGWFDRNGGNFSFRVAPGFIIKSTGVWINKVTAEDFVRVVSVKDGRVFYEGNKLPSSECRSHALVYKTNSSINYIFHAHALDIADKEVLAAPACTLPVLPYGTPELAAALARLSRSCKFVIAKNHGVFAWGETFDDTLQTLINSYEKYC
jgi:L-ribulose-5-phosphate 4-epimerase